jgi:hypothetical protein
VLETGRIPFHRHHDEIEMLVVQLIGLWHSLEASSERLPGFGSMHGMHCSEKFRKALEPKLIENRYGRKL